jgi:hypothetical protein
LSYHAIQFVHPGQRDRGRTTDSSTGHRSEQTFRKDPRASPKRNAMAAAGNASRGISLIGPPDPVPGSTRGPPLRSPR